MKVVLWRKRWNPTRLCPQAMSQVPWIWKICLPKFLTWSWFDRGISHYLRSKRTNSQSGRGELTDDILQIDYWYQIPCLWWREFSRTSNMTDYLGEQGGVVCTAMMQWVHMSVLGIALRALGCSWLCLCSIISSSLPVPLSCHFRWAAKLAHFTPDLASRILLEIPITNAVLNHYSHVSCSFADLHFYFFIWLQKSTTPLSEFEAVDLVKDTFASAAERDIYTVIMQIHL
jgi:hypothetical protein